MQFNACQHAVECMPPYIILHLMLTIWGNDLVHAIHYVCSLYVCTNVSGRNVNYSACKQKMGSVWVQASWSK
jgi:hypothetical protein